MSVPPIITKLQHPRCAGEHCHGDWLAQPPASEACSCAFSWEGFAPVALESSSHAARRSSSRASATSFTLLSSVDVLDLPGLGSLSMLTEQPRKRLAQRGPLWTHHKLYSQLLLNKYRVHYWYNEYTCFFLKPLTAMDVILTSIASSNPRYCQLVHYFCSYSWAVPIWWYSM